MQQIFIFFSLFGDIFASISVSEIHHLLVRVTNKFHEKVPLQILFHSIYMNKITIKMAHSLKSLTFVTDPPVMTPGGGVGMLMKPVWLLYLGGT